MAKRGFLFQCLTNVNRDYDTERYGWTLTSWELTPAEQITNYIQVPGRSGSLDLSTAQTRGVPIYGDRTLTVTLELSEGTRADRIIEANKVKRLTGYTYNIWCPDDEGEKLLIGRIVSVKENFNDLAHASVTITAICEPYKYSAFFHKEIYTVAGTLLADPDNFGDKPVVPTITVTDAPSSITLIANGTQWALANGTHILPGLIIAPGTWRQPEWLNITLVGTGTVEFEYQEAYIE